MNDKPERCKDCLYFDYKKEDNFYTHRTKNQLHTCWIDGKEVQPEAERCHRFITNCDQMLNGRKTKEIFGAPWVVAREEIRKGTTRFNVIENNLDIVAVDCTPENAHRIARLPQLFDALVDAALGRCWACAGIGSDILESGCPKKNDETCYVAKWWKIIKFVKEGK